MNLEATNLKNLNERWGIAYAQSRTFFGNLSVCCQNLLCLQSKNCFVLASRSALFCCKNIIAVQNAWPAVLIKWSPAQKNDRLTITTKEYLIATEQDRVFSGDVFPFCLSLSWNWSREEYTRFTNHQLSQKLLHDDLWIDRTKDQ